MFTPDQRIIFYAGLLINFLGGFFCWYYYWKILCPPKTYWRTLARYAVYLVPATLFTSAFPLLYGTSSPMILLISEIFLLGGQFLALLIIPKTTVKKAAMCLGSSIILLFIGNLIARLTVLSLYATSMFKPLSKTLFSQWSVSFFSMVYQSILNVVASIAVRAYIDKHPVETKWAALAVTVFSQSLLLMALVYVLFFMNADIGSVVIVCILGGLALVSDVLLIITFRRVVHNAELAEKIKLMEQAEALRDTQYRQVSGHVQALHSLRHDYRNTLSTIAVLMDAGQYQQARSLVQATDQLVSEECNVYTGNPVVDAVLSIKKQEAQLLGIAFTCALFPLPHVAVADRDLLSIFSNLLDNAIEAAAKAPPDATREIHVTNAYQGRMLVLRFENTCPDGIPPDVNNPVSTKPDPRNHGHGLNIVRSIAEAYQGGLSASYLENRICITVLLSQPPLESCADAVQQPA